MLIAVTGLYLWRARRPASGNGLSSLLFLTNEKEAWGLSTLGDLRMDGRILAIGGLIVLLSGCTLLGQEKEPVVAAAPAAAPAEPEEKAPALPSPRPPNLEDRYAALQPDVPDVEAQEIIGMDFVDLRALLGAPSVKETRAPAEIWTYSGESCSLQVFFYPQVGENGYRALIYEMKQQQEIEQNLSDRERENACLSTLLEERASGRSVV